VPPKEGTVGPMTQMAAQQAPQYLSAGDMQVAAPSVSQKIQAISLNDETDVALSSEEWGDENLMNSKIARSKGYEGDPCGECGQFTMVRSGTCTRCVSCGSTSGCS